jgi:non-heme chloroperoxidase
MTARFKSLLSALTSNCARDGTRLAYREFPGGRGQIAILIHGSTADARAMQALGHSLAEQSILAYALDMRGHGVSGPRGDIDYVGQLEDDMGDFVELMRTPNRSCRACPGSANSIRSRALFSMSIWK